jgi:transcriptional regulator with XRE-family HTH domain
MYPSTLTPLRFGRLRSGVPQYVLAKRARLAPSRLSVLERGYDEPSAYERSALAAVLGIPAEELFPVVPTPVTSPPNAAPGASR